MAIIWLATLEPRGYGDDRCARIVDQEARVGITPLDDDIRDGDVIGIVGMILSGPRGAVIGPDVGVPKAMGAFRLFAGRACSFSPMP